MSRFRFSVPITVRFRDCDPMGHVNNAVYLTYLEVARFAYWQDVAGGRWFGGAGFIVARAEIDYKAPAKTGDVLQVNLAITGFGRTSFVFEYDLTDQDGRHVASARTVQVMYDYSKESPVPVVDEFRQLIALYESLDAGGRKPEAGSRKPEA